MRLSGQSGPKYRLVSKGFAQEKVQKAYMKTLQQDVEKSKVAVVWISTTIGKHHHVHLHRATAKKTNRWYSTLTQRLRDEDSIRKKKGSIYENILENNGRADFTIKGWNDEIPNKTEEIRRNR